MNVTDIDDKVRALLRSIGQWLPLQVVLSLLSCRHVLHVPSAAGMREQGAVCVWGGGGGGGAVMS